MATKTNTTINGHNYYRITRTIGHEYKDGKKVPIKKQFLGRSKGEAEDKYDRWKEKQILNKTHVVDSNKTMGELADFFRDNVFDVSTDYATSTKDRYKRAYGQFSKADSTSLLSKSIQDVTSSDVQLAYNKFDVHLSTVQALNKFFRLFFNWAMLNRYCADVLSPVTIPVKKYTKRSEDIVTWTDNELKAIEKASKGHPLRFLLILARYSGMRMGECLGIKYSDFYDDTIHVQRQLTREFEYVEPKYHSKRNIPMHKVVAKELEAHKAMQQFESEYVFCTSNNRPYDHSSIRHQLKHFYEDNDITPKKFHAYRATLCTNLCKAKVPIQVASKIMGHKSVETTAKFYTFVSDQEKIDAINKLSQL